MCGAKFCSMKITQEVRDFAARQNAGAPSSKPPAPPFALEPVEGLSVSSVERGERAAPTTADQVRGRTKNVQAEAERGMAEMSEKFPKLGGGEVYVSPSC
jgi:phosphomethylpyrimidine synthase